MINPPRTPVKPPKVAYETIKEWTKGVYSRLDRNRVPNDGLVVTENVWLSQNGTLTPRPGLKLYGTQPVGTVLGKPFEYVRLNNGKPETWLVWMENRSGVGTLVTAKDGGTALVCTGKTYDGTAKAHFEQVYGQVMVMNGVDTLSYMDVQTQTITAVSALAQPSAAPTVTINGVTGTNLTLHYRYSATNLGETSASPIANAAVSKLRNQWNGTTENVALSFPRISGAQRYNIYVGDQTGFEYFLDSVADPGSGTTVTYTDTGSIALTSTRVAPVGDSTAGPKVTRATNVKGQIFLVGDKDNPYRIWFGGNGQSALDFSSYNGGGWVEPNKGGKDFPVVIKPFRDGKGTPMAVCLSKGTNGTGKRYLLQPSTTTVGSTVISYMSVQEDNGADGTDSPDAVIFMNDALWYPSRSKFNTTMTKAQIQNILSTQGITDNIAPDVLALSAQYMDAADGIGYDQRILWSVPYNSTTNSQIWILDLRNGGAWVRPWYIAADGLWLYADNTDGKTKVLSLVNNKFCELDILNTTTSTNDLGTAFPTTIGFPELKFGDNNEYASVLDVTFEFLKPQGNINLSVTATTEDGIVTLGDTMQSSANQAVSAWGRYGFSGSGWGEVQDDVLATSSVAPRKKWTIDVDEECQSISMGIATNDAGIQYELSKIIIRYLLIGWKDQDN